MLLNTTVTSWDRDARQLTVDVRHGPEQRVLSYDYLVLACGTVPNPSLIDGLGSYPSICSIEDVPKMQSQLQQLIERATALAATAATEPSRPPAPLPQQLTFVLVISSIPYKCPPGPIEIICIVEDVLAKADNKKTHVRDQVKLILTCPIEWPMPLKTRETFLDKLRQRRIEYKPMHSLDRIDTGTNTLHYSYRNRAVKIRADYIWAVYPIEAPGFCLRALMDQERKKSVATTVKPTTSKPLFAKPKLPPKFVEVADRQTFAIDHVAADGCDRSAKEASGQDKGCSRTPRHYAIGDVADIAIFEKLRAKLVGANIVQYAAVSLGKLCSHFKQSAARLQLTSFHLLAYVFSRCIACDVREPSENLRPEEWRICLEDGRRMCRCPSSVTATATAVIGGRRYEYGEWKLRRF